jgi:ATP-dependent protease ClpP protease subunit
MIHAKIYNEIGTTSDALMLKSEGLEDAIFTAETISNLFAQHPEETDFMFHINCAGGNTAEGLACYDLLRTSGKNIFMNIDGACHSMAVTLLLAAPLENRTANPNAKALIHNVKASPRNVGADQLRMMAEIVEKEQSTILNIYSERTGKDVDTLSALMKEERVHTAEVLLQYGFISQINKYSNNFKTKTMSNKKFAGLINSAETMIQKLTNLLEGAPETVNYEFMDAEGVVLFTTEKEDDSLAVGDVATPDGTFTLPDGRVVVIAEGVVTEIQEPVNEMEVELNNLKNELAASQAALEASNAQIDEMKNALTESTNLMTELKNSLGSTHQVSTRNVAPKTPIVEEPKKFMYKGKK